MPEPRLATEGDIGLDHKSSISNRAARTEKILQKAIHNAFMLGVPDYIIFKQLNEAYVESCKSRAAHIEKKASEAAR